MSRVWTAFSLGVVGLIFGAAAGVLGALVLGLLLAAVGWHISRPKPEQAPQPKRRDLPVRAPIGAQPTAGTMAPGEAAVITNFLDDALARSIIDLSVHDRLVAALVQPAVVAAPAPVTPAPLTEPEPVKPPAPSPPPPPGPRRPAAPKAPPAWQRELTATWNRVASDFAVHGLAYLGVLLVFVATLGFVIFAFSDLGAAYRPVGEAAIPVVLFGAALFLRTRGAPHVSASLELLGGALTPVVLFAAFTDGADVPPDLEDAALVATLAGASLLLAAAYALAASRRPESLLRYLVAPLVWVAAAVLGLAIAGEPSAGQFAVAALAVVATTAAAASRPLGVLTRPMLAAAAPGVAAASVLTVLFSAGAGWEPVPVIVAAAAVTAIAEIVPSRVGMPWLVQAGAAGGAAAVAAVAWGPAPVGVAVVVAFLLLTERWASAPTPIAAPALLGGAAIGVVMSGAGPGALLASTAVASVWSHYRRFRPVDEMGRILATAAAVLLPLPMGWSLVQLIGAGEAVLAGSTTAALVVVVTRAMRPLDRFYRWWASGIAVAAVVSTAVAYEAGEPVGLLAGAAGLASLAVAAGAGPRPARAWVAGAGLVATELLGLEAAGITAADRPAVVAVTAVAALLAALYWRAEPAGHVAALAHLVGLGALAAAETPEARLIALAALAGGFLAEAVADEVTGSPLVRMAGSGTVARAAAPVLAAITLPVVAAEAADQSGLLRGHPGRLGFVLAALAVTYAGAGRLLRARRPMSPVAAVAGFALALISIGAAESEPWALIAAVAAPIVVTVAIGPSLRHPLMVWTSWVTSAGLTLLIAERLGAADDHLPIVLLGWGAAAMLGGLLADDVVSGRRFPGQGVRRVALVPPAVVGAVAVPVALALAIGGQDPASWWGWALGTGALYIAVAGVLRAGGVSAAAYVLAAIGLGGLAAVEGISPLDRPLLFVAGAAVLTALSAVVARVGGERDPWLGWDLAPLVVAHGLIAAGLLAAVPASAVEAVWPAAGALLLAVAAWKRLPAWALAGAALIVAGAAVAGPGWLALALAGLAAAATGAAVATEPPIRTAMQWLGAAAAGGAWIDLTGWADWSPGVTLATAAIGGGAVVLVLAIAARYLALADEWVWPWAALAVLGTGAALALAPDLGREQAGWGMAASFGLWTMATALAARPLRLPWLREAAAALAIGAGAAAGYALALDATDAAAAGITAGIVATLSVLAMWIWREGSPWARPLVLAAALANGIAAVAAATALPDLSLLVPVLAAAGLEAFVAGAVQRRAGYLYAALALLTGSWLAFVPDALGGNPHWYTIPIGAALIAAVDVTRWDRRRRGAGTRAAEVVAVDAIAMALLVGASFAETVVTSTAFGALAMLLGAALVAWAAVTRVRRRLYGGAGAVALAAVLMVVVPVAGVVPQFRGLALWAIVFAAGTVMILIATYLERGRARVAAGVRRLEQILEDWE